MAELWYYTNEGKQMDPVTMKELKRLVTDGSLKPTDMVWKEGMGRWIRASSLKDLYPDPIAALDHYFTGAKGPAPQPIGAAGATGATAVMAFGNATANSKASKSSAESSSSDDSPQPSAKKRRPSSDTDDRSSRRSDAKQGGMSIGIILAILLGLGVVFGSLLVGVIFLVIAIRPDAPPAPQPIAPIAINDPPPGNPNDPAPKKNVPNDPMAPDNKKKDVLPEDVKTGNSSFTVSLSPGKQHEFKLFVKGGRNAFVRAKAQANKTADLNIAILQQADGAEIASDLAPDKNASVKFTRPADEIVRVRISNDAEVGPPIQCTVTFNGG